MNSILKKEVPLTLNHLGLYSVNEAQFKLLDVLSTLNSFMCLKLEFGFSFRLVLSSYLICYLACIFIILFDRVKGSSPMLFLSGR